MTIKSATNWLEDVLRGFAPVSALIIGALLGGWFAVFFDVQWDPTDSEPMIGYGSIVIGSGAAAALLVYAVITGFFSMINPMRHRDGWESYCVVPAAALSFCCAWGCFAGPQVLTDREESRIAELKEPQVVEVITDRGKMEEVALLMRQNGNPRARPPTRATVLAPVDNKSIQECIDRIEVLEQARSPIQTSGIILSALGFIILAMYGISFCSRRRSTGELAHSE